MMIDKFNGAHSELLLSIVNMKETLLDLFVSIPLLLSIHDHPGDQD